MAGRNHDATLPVQVSDREIEHGRRHHADADDINARGEQSRDERVMVGGRRMAAIMAHYGAADAATGEIGAACLAKAGYPGFVEVYVDHTPNVVGAEYIACFHGVPPENIGA